MPNLKQLDKNALSGIIKGFANNGIIFQSEAQFQFALAWELQLKKWGKAYLEDMNMKVVNKNKVVKKFYTDIVIEQEGYRVAIELKYKTAEYNGSGIELFDHGAVDLGRYDYLWDVFRIELLTNKSKQNIITPYTNNNNFQLDVSKECNKGFAVLLTNENKYWKQKYIKSPTTPVTIDNQFRIGESDSKLFGKKLYWGMKNGNYPPKTVAGTFRAQPIYLNVAYNYKWEDYLNTSLPNGKFRFVIIEVQ